MVEPPGIRKYLQYLTARNLLIGLAILLAICVLIYVIHLSNESDEHLTSGKALEQSHRPLAFSHKGLGAVKGKKDRISFDATNDAIIVSGYDPESGVLRSDTVQLGDHLEGFRQSSFQPNVELQRQEGTQQQQLPAFDDCMRFTEQLVCCSTPSQSHQHMTKCFLRSPGQNVTSVASMFDFMPRWQSLLDGRQLVLVHNRQRQAFLDVRNNLLNQIEEDRLPQGYISKGFHFDQQTADELVELVHFGDEFRICEYVRTRQVDQEHGKYTLKDQNCRSTPFKVEFELPRVLFCANSLYTALVQFGHLQAEPTRLTWRLRVKFDSSPTIYSAGESMAATRQETMALNCDDERLDLFVLGDHELHQFWVQLPTPRNGHFIQQEEEKRR